MSLTYTCTLCRTPFTSLLIPRENAAKEVGEKLQVHLREKHRLEFENFITINAAQIQTLALGIALTNKFVTFDPLDSTSKDEYDGHVVRLMELMGFDLSEAPEDGEDEIELPDDFAELETTNEKENN